MIILKIILIPVSLIYSVIISLRNKLYDRKIFKSSGLPAPVISVGNISTGGTGKTPLVIYIAKYFLKQDLKVGIVSRGYKRKSKEMVLVCNGEKINYKTDESGDELIMIASELIKDNKYNIFIAACADRVKAGNYLINEFKADVIILDDAFQHRKIQRNTDIVIIDAADYYNNVLNNLFTIPTGNLRESYSNIKRSDIVIQNNKISKLELIPDLSEMSKIIFSMRYKTEYIMDYKNSILTLNKETKINAIVFSGIANDDSFIKLISEEGINISAAFKYSDHYNYDEEDIEFLISQYKEGSIFLTTEKDFVKIKSFEKLMNSYPVYFLKLRIDLSENASFFNKLLDKTIK